MTLSVLIFIVRRLHACRLVLYRQVLRAPPPASHSVSLSRPPPFFVLVSKTKPKQTMHCDLCIANDATCAVAPRSMHASKTVSARLMRCAKSRRTCLRSSFRRLSVCFSGRRSIATNCCARISWLRCVRPFVNTRPTRASLLQIEPTKFGSITIDLVYCSSHDNLGE